jgi:isoleucyl-tRNA synthetase
MLSPIISFTAEEAWSERYGSSKSIFESQISSTSYIDSELELKWDKLLSVREPILKEIELAREKKLLGSSLEAKISLGVSMEDYNFYLNNKNLLMKTLIISEISIYESGSADFDIKVEKTNFEKCGRCWMYFPSESFADLGCGELCEKCNNQLKKNV